MRKTSYLCALLRTLALPGIAGVLLAWGFKGHQEINRLAVFTLPPELFGFYKQHIRYVSEHAVDPDKRRYAFAEEAPRHFIDLDRYGTSPLDSLPKNWQDAVAKYTADTLTAHGILPWHLRISLASLTKAFRERDANRALKASADLGHYMADAHVPLHCTRNYNGQLTNQHGIHGLWETRLPELFFNSYDPVTARARYISDKDSLIWLVLSESYSLVDSVLLLERELDRVFPPHRKYAMEERGGQLVKVYSQDYSTDYHQKLSGMVESRLRLSAYRVGCFWYTAWVDAGMPDVTVWDRFAPDYQADSDSRRLDSAFSNRNSAVHGHVD
ncbi:MAG: zinc dependent phospholipase C family protein [Bacteroidota bacterium]